MGVRDNNELSWTQVLEIVEFMSDAVKIPILLDGDTGYGNYNNMRRLLRKPEQRDVAGVCIEDKLFPKTNSFLGQRQPRVMKLIRSHRSGSVKVNASIISRMVQLLNSQKLWKNVT
jgi:2-methylisocitrate lyase-like PEP mutase family enzyme